MQKPRFEDVGEGSDERGQDESDLVAGRGAAVGQDPTEVVRVDATRRASFDVVGDLDGVERQRPGEPGNGECLS